MVNLMLGKMLLKFKISGDTKIFIKLDYIVNILSINMYFRAVLILHLKTALYSTLEYFLTYSFI